MRLHIYPDIILLNPVFSSICSSMNTLSINKAIRCLIKISRNHFRFPSESYSCIRKKIRLYYPHGKLLTVDRRVLKIITCRLGHNFQQISPALYRQKRPRGFYLSCIRDWQFIDSKIITVSVCLVLEERHSCKYRKMMTIENRGIKTRMAASRTEEHGQPENAMMSEEQRSPLLLL